MLVKKNNKTLIYILLGIIIFLVFLIILINTNILNFNSKNVNYISNTLAYKEYKLFEEITLSDNSKWLVIQNSSKDSDYVTLIKKEALNISEEQKENILSELRDSNSIYTNSELKKYINSLAKDIPVQLKNVNGYEIRLISIEEFMDLDDKWNYDSNMDTYTYQGNNHSQLFDIGITMSKTKCNKDMCNSFYVTTKTETTYTITSNQTQLVTIKPVINVYKAELKNY